MAIQIRLLLENEVESANDFFNSIYKTNRSIKNFRWEFLDGPNGKAIYVIAVDESASSHQKIVGIQCAIPIELVDAKGNIVLTAKSEDTLVDPGYRGQKIFERMYDVLFAECKKAGIKYIWGFTPAKKAFERIGFEIPFQAHQGLLAFNPPKTYAYLSVLNPQNKWVDKIKIAGLSVLSFMTGFKRLLLISKSIESLNLPLESKSDVIKTLVPQSSLHFLNMTEKYMEWRIAKNPFNNQYQSFQFFKEGVLIADAIVNIREPKLGYIEQFIFSEKLDEHYKLSVIIKLIGIMKAHVDLIRLMCFDINKELKDQEKLFRRCGFTLLNRGGYFVWKNLDSDEIIPNQLFLSRLFTQGNQ